MFPGAGAQVYYNEAGEPLGWDYPSDEPYERDDYAADSAAEAAAEDAYDDGEFDARTGEPRNDSYSGDDWVQQCYNEGFADGTPKPELEEDE